MKQLLIFDSLNTEYRTFHCSLSNMRKMYMVKKISSFGIKWSELQEMHSNLFDCWKYYYADRLKRNAANRNI